MDEKTSKPPPPPPREMPPKRAGRFRGGEDASFSVVLKTVTPILGGGFFTGLGATDHLGFDTIRVPTIRGHLRFWWRALQPPGMSAAELREREKSLWGGMGGGAPGEKKEPSASRVNVRVEAVAPDRPEVDESNPLNGKGSYSLFPAREQTKDRRVIRETLPRLKPGITFTLRVSCPPARRDEVKAAVRAWILFGGYGSRTRRGLGSLTVTQDSGEWLPKSVDELKRLFDGAGSTGDTPSLAGSSLVVGAPNANAEYAWDLTVSQLQRFRQEPNFARNPGRAGNRPGQSRWPEPDKIRWLTGKVQGHPPRKEFTKDPAWPRAQFGLPIVGRFAGPGQGEPGDFQLQWQAGGAAKPSDRLASALVLKALPLADGKFLPCALWLSRGFPAGKVVLVSGNATVPGSAAPFDAMQGKGDGVLHPALAGKPSVRQAFLDWLVADVKWKRVSG